jgi:predicted ATPase
MDLLADACNYVNETGERFYEAELHRLKGELTFKWPTGDVNHRVKQAEACFERAITIAREQQAKSWELRANTSLARLLAKQGHRHQARTMLAEIYDWFTEGFDTADLQDAKALVH